MHRAAQGLPPPRGLGGMTSPVSSLSLSAAVLQTQLAHLQADSTFFIERGAAIHLRFASLQHNSWQNNIFINRTLQLSSLLQFQMGQGVPPGQGLPHTSHHAERSPNRRPAPLQGQLRLAHTHRGGNGMGRRPDQRITAQGHSYRGVNVMKRERPRGDP